MALQGRAVLRVLYVAGLLLAALPQAAPARAASFTVTTTADAPNVNPVGTTCQSTLPGALCTLRAAIQAANNTPEADTITLPPGTYDLTVAGSGEDGGATGDLDVISNLTLVGAGAGSTTINGNGTDRVFDLSASVVSISDVTITGGSVCCAFLGGGILNRGALTLSNVTVTGNSADLAGGIYNQANTGQLTVSGSTISGNTTSSGGGGIFNDVAGRLTLTNTTISGNTAGAGNGGGLASLGPLTMTNVIVSDNTGTSAGGIQNGGAATLNQVTIGPNNRAAFAGGGFANASGVTANLTNVTISGNLTDPGGLGGGVFNQNTGVTTLTNVTINANQSSNGGGIYNDSGAADVQVKNTIVANSVGGLNCAGATSPPVTTLGGNLELGTSCGFAPPADRPSANPNLERFANRLLMTVHSRSG